MTVQYNRYSSFEILTQLRGSALNAIGSQLIYIVILSIIACCSYEWGNLRSNTALKEEEMMHLVLTPVALLLVFRSNIAYHVYWAGRGNIGKVVYCNININRMVASYLSFRGIQKKPSPELLNLKIEMVETIFRLTNLLFAVAKDTLGSEGQCFRSSNADEKPEWVTTEELKVLQSTKCKHVVIGQWITMCLNASQRYLDFDEEIFFSCDNLIQQAVLAISDANSGKIILMPLPFVQLLNVGLLSSFTYMPFTFVFDYGWFTIIVVFVLGIAFFGTNAVSGEISDPFGDDENDFPLENMAASVLRITAELNCLPEDKIEFLKTADNVPSCHDVIRRLQEARKPTPKLCRDCQLSNSFYCSDSGMSHALTNK